METQFSNSYLDSKEYYKLHEHLQTEEELLAQIYEILVQELMDSGLFERLRQEHGNLLTFDLEDLDEADEEDKWRVRPTLVKQEARKNGIVDVFDKAKAHQEKSAEAEVIDVFYIVIDPPVVCDYDLKKDIRVPVARFYRGELKPARGFSEEDAKQISKMISGLEELKTIGVLPHLNVQCDGIYDFDHAWELGLPVPMD